MADATGHRGRRALVTGATRGVGRAVVQRLAAEGARVVGCHRTTGFDAAGLAEELGPDHRLVVADVSDPDSVAELVRAAVDHLGGLDLVVNNVGHDDRASVEELSAERWQSMIDTNLGSAFHVVHRAVDALAPGASIVNVGASAATRGRPHAAHYVAAKAGMHGLTLALAKELGPRGISVNTVAPGVIDDEHLPPPLRERLTGLTPMGRLASPDDVAAAVLAISRPELRFLSGNLLAVDGAF